MPRLGKRFCGPSEESNSPPIKLESRIHTEVVGLEGQPVGQVRSERTDYKILKNLSDVLQVMENLSVLPMMIGIIKILAKMWRLRRRQGWTEAEY